jgi:hypothetical protein
MRIAVLIPLIAGACSVAPASAQTPSPPGPYVIDVRGAFSGLPTQAAFLPALPSATAIPSRGFGFEAGGHVYLLSLGPARLGLGVSVLRARGTASTVTETAALPDVAVTLTAIAPQVSFNFGTRDGWSYLSAGYGRAQVRAIATPATGSTLQQDSGGVAAINFGGGARWFLRDHLAVGFDVRFHRLSAPASTMPVAVAVGFSLR